MDERALRRMAHDVDEQHRESMRTLHDDLAEAHFGWSGVAAASRRHFLKRAAAGGAVMFGATAVPLSTLVAFSPAAGAETAKESMSSGDIALAQFAQSLELAAVAAYKAIDESRVLTAATAEVARMFALHHQDHADALGKILTAGGAEPVTEPNAAVVRVVRNALAGANNDKAVLRAAYDLEEGAAATYLLAIGSFESATAAGAGATILPVESQHAVVWGQVLELPASDYLPTFVAVDGAFDPSIYAIS